MRYKFDETYKFPDEEDIKDILVSITNTKRDSTEYDNAVAWLSSLYGFKRGLFLANRLAKMVRNANDPCMDNFRVAKQSNILEMYEYGKQRKNGCCGFYDDEYIFKVKLLGITIWKEKYFLGFNYGH